MKLSLKILGFSALMLCSTQITKGMITCSIDDYVKADEICEKLLKTSNISTALLLCSNQISKKIITRSIDDYVKMNEICEKLLKMDLHSNTELNNTMIESKL